ncbi:MAG: hypothetical protein HDS00_06930 [Bacteroides sp.]|nr:hypothetical protein [Bacteroides sp.]
MTNDIFQKIFDIHELGDGRDAAERGQLPVRRGRRPDVTGRKDGQYIADPEGGRISTISDPAGVVFMGVHLPRVTGACGSLTRGWPMMRLWRITPASPTRTGGGRDAAERGQLPVRRGRRPDVTGRKDE